MTTTYDAPHDELDGTGAKITRIALAVIVILIVVMWVWIYIWAPRDNPDRLETRSFAEAAETLCGPLEQQIDALPRTTTETTVSERAQHVAEGTQLTATMVAGLKAEAESVTDENDLQLLELWFGDWDAYVLDREAYFQRLETAPADTRRSDLPFTLTERSDGGLYTRTIDGFAEVNDMPACGVPGDI